MNEPEPQAPPRLPVWPALAGFGGLLVAVALAQMIEAGGVALLHRDDLAVAHDKLGRLADLLTSTPLLALNIAATCVAVIGTALLAARLLGGPVAVRLRLGPARIGPVGYLAALAGVLALGNALEGLSSHLPIPSASLPALSAAAHGPLAQFVPLLLVGAIGAGVGEELFFRGFMARVLAARWSRVATVVVTAAAFGLVHGDPLHSPLAFVLGLFLGLVAEEAGSVRPTIFAHVLNNATSFLSDRYDLGREAQGPMGIAASLGVVVVCVVLLRREASVGPSGVLPANPG